MLDIYLQVASLLTVAMLFGGMFLFSGGFAAFLFRHLPPEGARMLIRKAFPPFYMFVIAASGLAMVLPIRVTESAFCGYTAFLFF
jgi:hypothetical protein